jgi:glycerophosphoryl diester phosphodiesterase
LSDVFVVAHRTPTTPAACAALVAAGVSYFELDIQLSARGIVVSHFLPLFGVRGWIENDNWRFRWRSARDPSVSDVLACIPDGVNVLLDPKETDASRRAELVRRVAELPDQERFVVSTSALDDLASFRESGLRTWRTIKNAGQLRAVLAGGPLPDEGVSVRHTLLDANTLNRLHAVVPSVVGWTVNDLGRARSLYQWGIDGITTDQAEEITQISRR